MHLHQGDAERLTDLFSLDDADHLLTSTAIRTPQVRLARDGAVLPESAYTRGATLAGSQPWAVAYSHAGASAVAAPLSSGRAGSTLASRSSTNCRGPAGRGLSGGHRKPRYSAARGSAGNGRATSPWAVTASARFSSPRCSSTASGALATLRAVAATLAWAM